MNYENLLTDVTTALNSHQWNQSAWHRVVPECGTTHCIAGFADLRLNGDRYLETKSCYGLIDLADDRAIMEDWGVTLAEWDVITDAKNDRSFLSKLQLLLKKAIDEDASELEGFLEDHSWSDDDEDEDWVFEPCNGFPF